jgi:GTPase SAR1 family protein
MEETDFGGSIGPGDGATIHKIYVKNERTIPMEFQNHVKIRSEKFGAVIFETLREKVFVTNGTGAEILRLLEEKKKPEKIMLELTEDYDGDPEIIKKEAQEFIAELQANHLCREDLK